MILGIDVSHWNDNLDWSVMYQGGVRFAFVKLSQGTSYKDARAQDHVEKAKKAGILVGGYHWADPTQDDNRQADLAISIAKSLGLVMVAVDAEQYWESWTEYFQNAVVNFISGNRISDNAKNVMNRIKSVGMQSVIYTRGTFVNSRAVPMWQWLREGKHWYATYPYKKGREEITWETLLGSYYPVGSPSALALGVDWDFWQFSGDKFILPGTGKSPIDLNFYKGDYMSLAKLFGETVVDPEPPTPEPTPTGYVTLKVVRNVLVRTQDTTASQSLRLRPVGEIVNIEELKVLSSASVWGRDKSGWSAIVHNGVVYMKEVRNV